MFVKCKNKYAIHAYTHDPVTGSGIHHTYLVVASYPWPGELAKGSSSLLLPPPPSSSSLSKSM